MYAVMTFQKNIWESRYIFDFRLGILCSKQPIKKVRFNSKILCPQSPSFSRAKPAKRNERAMGTRMEDVVFKVYAMCFRYNYMKGVPFFSKRYTKGERFLSKWFIKWWGFRARGGAFPYKIFWSNPPSPLSLGGYISLKLIGVVLTLFFLKMVNSALGHFHSRWERHAMHPQGEASRDDARA